MSGTGTFPREPCRKNIYSDSGDSRRKIILKATEKTAERPLPPDGIGKPPGNHSGSRPGVVSVRDDEAVYKEAERKKQLQCFLTAVRIPISYMKTAAFFRREPTKREIFFLSVRRQAAENPEI